MATHLPSNRPPRFLLLCVRLATYPTPRWRMTGWFLRQAVNLSAVTLSETMMPVTAMMKPMVSQVFKAIYQYLHVICMLNPSYTELPALIRKAKTQGLSTRAQQLKLEALLIGACICIWLNGGLSPACVATQKPRKLVGSQTRLGLTLPALSAAPTEAVVASLCRRTSSVLRMPEAVSLTSVTSTPPSQRRTEPQLNQSTALRKTKPQHEAATMTKQPRRQLCGLQTGVVSRASKPRGPNLQA